MERAFVAQTLKILLAEVAFDAAQFHLDAKFLFDELHGFRQRQEGIALTASGASVGTYGLQ
jgi:hypothetical protein